MKKVNAVPEERLLIAIAIVGSIKESSCTSAEGAFYLFANAESKLGRSYRGQVIKSVGALGIASGVWESWSREEGGSRSLPIVSFHCASGAFASALPFK
jgi:hypothetical protein